MAILDTLRRLTGDANGVAAVLDPPSQMSPPIPQGMSATVQHPMHAMIAPIVGAPRPGAMVPPPDTDPEPAAMSPADIAGTGSDATLPQTKVRTMTPMERQSDNLNTKLMADYAKDENPWGSPQNHHGFLGKLGHLGSQFIANAHHVSGELTPREQEEQRLGGQLQQSEAAASSKTLKSAQADKAQQQAEAAQPVEISPDQAQELEAPELAGTKVAPAVLATLYKQLGINTQRQTANELTNQTRQTANELTNQTRLGVAQTNALSHETIAKLKPEQRDDRAISINQKLAQGQPITPEEGSYLKAYAKYIDQTKIQPGVARAQAYGMFRPVGTVDPTTGNVIWDYSGHAIATHAAGPQSMNFRTGVGMAKFMTSGKGGQTITAYNTANDHLDLLGKAMDALDNGDVQALNQLNNSFKQQFGSAAPTNVNAVKAMLAGELANVAKVTGATDAEIKEQKDNINRAASPEQIRGFIDTNHDLMDQKAYEMYQQYQQGMEGKPAFSSGLTGRGPQNVTPSSKAPKAGMVEDGYRFKGGDPGKPENWEKVK